MQLIHQKEPIVRELQQKIIAELGVKPTIDPEEEVLKRSQYLADYLGEYGLRGFVLGISGGQDSLLAGILAKQATEIANTRGHQTEFHAMLLPYGTQADRNDALTAIKVIKPHAVHDQNIAAATDAYTQTFADAEHTPLSDFNRGNVKARMRMIAQYAIAGEHNLVVVGTDHAAEAITGFYTKYGDGGADIVPLAGLNKRQGRQLLTYLGAPALFIQKAPTADLLDNTPSQPDETELGVSYDDIDDYLEGKDIDPVIAEKLEYRFLITAHKRRMPAAYTDK